MNTGIFICGPLIGYESKPKRDGSGVTTNAMVACGMDSYRVSVKAEEVPKLYETGQFEDVCVRARPFVSNGRLYWTDGELVPSSEG